VDPTKVQAIKDMPVLKTEKQVRSFFVRINYIARFIVQLTSTCNPLFKLLKKDMKIEWIDESQAAFDMFKRYLLNLPILVPLTPDHPLILYIAVQEAPMGYMLSQLNELDQKEKVIYYLSKKFTSCEINYITIEKTCCALAWALRKLQTVHALLYLAIDFPNGPHQVYLRKACPYREDSCW